MELQKELVRLCDALNRAEIKYIVVGGCAVILHGYYRTTHDIDLIVDTAPVPFNSLSQQPINNTQNPLSLIGLGNDHLHGVSRCTIDMAHLRDHLHWPALSSQDQCLTSEQGMPQMTHRPLLPS